MISFKKNKKRKKIKKKIIKKKYLVYQAFQSRSAREIEEEGKKKCMNETL